MSILKTATAILIVLGVMVFGYGLVLNNHTISYCEEGKAPTLTTEMTPQIATPPPTPVSSSTPSPVITPTPMATSIRTPTRIRTSSPHPPVYSVTTNPATSISATYAVLHGTLTLIEPAQSMYVDDFFHWNGYSEDKTWSFDIHTYNFFYGGQHSIGLGGLKPNTTYYFRAYAYGRYGQYLSFTTLPVDASPTPTPIPEPTPAPTPVRTCTYNPRPDHHNHFVISGCVLDSNTDLGIAGAEVSVHHFKTTTDRKGNYRIHLKRTNPASAPLTLTARAAGYQTQTVAVHSISGKITQDIYLNPQTASTPPPSLVPNETLNPVRTVTPYRTATPRRSIVLTVSVSPDGCGSVYVNPPGVWTSSSVKLTYPYGTEVTLSALLMSYPHYLFSIWQGAVNVRQNSITITMNGDKSVTAKYYWSLPRTPSPTWTPTPILTPTPIPTMTPLNNNIIKVQLYNQNTMSTTNQIYANFRLVNISTGAIDLSDVKMRYYYTGEGTQSQAFYSDYAHVGGMNVTGTFVTMDAPKIGADRYLEVGFTSAAGSLAAGASTVIQSRVAKSDWSNYNQANDYSFNPLATTYVDWTKVTGYVSGVLQWGVEP